MIEILNPAELAQARVTGALVADILQAVKSRTTVGTNLLEIDEWAQAMIVGRSASTARSRAQDVVVEWYRIPDSR